MVIVRCVVVGQIAVARREERYSIVIVRCVIIPNDAILCKIIPDSEEPVRYCVIFDGDVNKI